MNRIVFSLLFVALAAYGASTQEDSAEFGAFGVVHLYYQSTSPAQVVLFASGDGGWNLGVIDMAQSLASLGALVAGIDIVHYLRALERTAEPCSYPAGDFELLSKFVQKKLNYPEYITPILVGYSSGATLVYAALVQAPSNTFKGAISLGFCPDLPVTKPFCKGDGLEWKPGPKGKGYSFLPATTLEVPWIALQGDIDQVCNPEETTDYVRQVKGGTIVQLQKVGHGFSVQKNWLPQFKQAFLQISNVQTTTPSSMSATELQDLPLIEVPSTGDERNVMAVHLTGDGGWGVTDKGLAKSLAENGIGVVGLNSLKYFWQRRDPETSGRDLQRILSHYLQTWQKEKVILIGYSFGADVLPFMIHNLPQESRAKIQLVVLLGPGQEADFQFHLTSWIGKVQKKTALPVLPEIEKLRGMKIFCFYGETDKGCICNDLAPGLVAAIPMKGGHRIRNHYDPILQEILRAVD